MDDYVFIPPSWRRALPRIGVDETSELPLRDLATMLAAAGERAAAADAFREIIEASPDDLRALEGLAAVLSRLGRDEEEAAVLRRIAALIADRMGVAPEQREAVIAFELASLGVAEAPPAPPDTYVAACFDVFAEGFDQQLREALSYLGPEQILDRLTRVFGAGDGTLDVCDVGCGTGLLGPLLRPFARRLDGVDVSPRMLDKARARGVYDALDVADLTGLLASRPGAYDVVTAADVFVYLGDLAPAFGAIAAALRDEGLFFFTVERATGEGGAGYELAGTARYSHAAAYLRATAAAAGLVEVSIEDDILRRDRGRPVHSLTCVFRKARVT